MKMTNIELVNMIEANNTPEKYEASLRETNMFSEDQIKDLVKFNTEHSGEFAAKMKAAKNSEEMMTAYHDSIGAAVEKMKEMLNEEQFNQMERQLKDAEFFMKDMFDHLEYVSEKDNNVEVNSIEEVLKIKAAAREQIEQTAIEAGLN